jgi:hypothetical protein
MAEYMGFQQASNNTPKKPSPSKRKRSNSNLASPAATPKKVARVKKEPAPKKTPIKNEAVTTRAGPNIKQEYRSSPIGSTPSRSRVKQEHNYPDPYSAYIKSDPHPNPYQPESSILLSGNYAIDCQTASDIFNDYNLDLTLSLDPSRGIL